MLQKMIFDGSKQSVIEGIGQYSQSLVNNMLSEHMLKVEKMRILSSILYAIFQWNFSGKAILNFYVLYQIHKYFSINAFITNTLIYEWTLDIDAIIDASSCEISKKLQ